MVSLLIPIPPIGSQVSVGKEKMGNCSLSREDRLNTDVALGYQGANSEHRTARGVEQGSRKRAEQSYKLNDENIGRFWFLDSSPNMRETPSTHTK